MSLDLYLHMPKAAGGAKPAGSGIFIRFGGEQFEITEAEWYWRNPGTEPVRVVLPDDDGDDRTTVWHRNITHNLNRMAMEAGLYDVLWRPDEHGLSTARDCERPAAIGLDELMKRPEHFKQWNPENGWGDYDLLVSFTASFLAACRAHPEATVYACR